MCPSTHQPAGQGLLRQQERGEVLQQLGPVLEQGLQASVEIHRCVPLGARLELIDDLEEGLVLARDVLQGFSYLCRKTSVARALPLGPNRKQGHRGGRGSYSWGAPGFSLQRPLPRQALRSVSRRHGALSKE